MEVKFLYDRTQMNKGILEGCILKILSNKSTYGYQILVFLTEAGFSTVKESTIYPLLVRLEKKEYITSYYEPSSIGPSRKYFRITQSGLQYLNDFIIAWKETEQFVNFILERQV